MTNNLKTILCVDDEQDILKITKFSLERIGNFTVETCINGKDAVTRAAGFRPDVILLDVMMPGMNGVETFKILHSQLETQHIPIIFMTAKVQPSEVEEYKAMGVAGVIAKPFDPMTLGETVSALWRECSHAA